MYKAVRRVDLFITNLGIVVQHLAHDPDSLVPDFLVEPRISDYLKKSDPVLKSVIEKEKPSGTYTPLEVPHPAGA